MKRLALAAPVAILASVFAGCSSPPPSSGGPVAINPQPVEYRAGTGVVQSVSPTPAAVVAGPNTSAKSPTPISDGGMQRLRIRMDDGRMVYADTPSREFRPGMRVQLSEAFEIRTQ
jgi:hypothetical protein